MNYAESANGLWMTLNERLRVTNLPFKASIRELPNYRFTVVLVPDDFQSDWLASAEEAHIAVTNWVEDLRQPGYIFLGVGIEAIPESFNESI